MLDVYEEARILESQSVTIKQIENELACRNLGKEELMELGSTGDFGNEENNVLYKYSSGQLRKLKEIMLEREYYNNGGI